MTSQVHRACKCSFSGFVSSGECTLLLLAPNSTHIVSLCHSDIIQAASSTLKRKQVIEESRAGRNADCVRWQTSPAGVRGRVGDNGKA